jgi:DNA-binding PadR family transcriptional regulator
MIARELIAASTRPLVLSILGEGETYGYALIQRVATLSEDRIEWTEGMLYPLLHRLEQEGLIQSRWQETGNGRRRKYYRIKHLGKEVLARDKEQWSAVNNTLKRIWRTIPVST